jgi:hypothetical protein
LHKISWIIRVSYAFSALLIGHRCNWFRKYLIAVCLLCSGRWNKSAGIIVSIMTGFLSIPIWKALGFVVIVIAKKSILLLNYCGNVKMWTSALDWCHWSPGMFIPKGKLLIFDRHKEGKNISCIWEWVMPQQSLDMCHGKLYILIQVLYMGQEAVAKAEFNVR